MVAGNSMNNAEKHEHELLLNTAVRKEYIESIHEDENNDCQRCHSDPVLLCNILSHHDVFVETVRSVLRGELDWRRMSRLNIIKQQLEILDQVVKEEEEEHE